MHFRNDKRMSGSIIACDYCLLLLGFIRDLRLFHFFYIYYLYLTSHSKSNIKRDIYYPSGDIHKRQRSQQYKTTYRNRYNLSATRLNKGSSNFNRYQVSEPQNNTFECSCCQEDLFQHIKKICKNYLLKLTETISSM